MASTEDLPENTPKFLILELFLIFYSIITLPVYFLIQQPWKIWKLKEHIWATHIKEGDPHSPVKRINRNTVSPIQGISTVDKLFRIAVNKYGIKKCHGVRNVLRESEESDGTGKVLRKLQLGDYQWYSYMETGRIVKNLSIGFLSLGAKAKEPVAIFAETRREWFLALQACARINVPVVTLYATLGEDGITHGIMETEVSVIITSQKLLPKLQKITDKVLTVKKIIYMEDATQADVSGFPANISVFKFSEVEERGKNLTEEVKYQSPSPDDLAVIMYTSGSTGTPKGVLITHKNILTSLDDFTDPLAEFNKTDIGIGYLPMAHLYELLVECLFFSLGVKVGYSSPYTLTDKSTGLMKGCKSDLALLQPTIFCGVPLLLDRMRKSINEAVAAKGPFPSALFRYALKYKEFWWKRGFRCPITNWLLFRNVHGILGGRVKHMICGGAHLSLDTELFTRVCFDVKFTPAYGATETTGSGTLTSTKDVNTGHVGAPIPGCYIKLVDWDEGGYKATDKPHPRGEIAISGDSISLGYFKNKELTEEVYKNEDGYRWFYTGDIGELLPNGTFKIIDRKKDLQKLQRGEYISLGKIEAEMKTSVLVDNICAIGSNAHDYLVAVIIPNESQLRKLAMEMGKEDLILQKLCQDKDLLKTFTDLFKEHGKKNGLQNQEIPQRVTLCWEEWLPDTGLVTAALKIRRKQIENFYKNAIDKMFETSR